ncbi:MAG TPA: hypothetical protein VFC00_31005 [Micromonosporaceae bacterium]|nr:hypothetical protein [Micromonosporaceae bacterium]
MLGAVMVGGPLHGQIHHVRRPEPRVLMVPRKEIFTVAYTTDLDPMMTMPQPHIYELRWYRSERTWMETGRQAAYLCKDEPEQIHPTPERPDDEESVYAARLAAYLWLQACEDALPGCIAPACMSKGRYKFTAAEHGRFAGRWWKPGDEIRLCPEHGDDVYRAQGMYGLDQLPDWLKPDVMLDLLDAVGMGAFADEIYQARGRVMRLKTHEGNG